LFLFIAIGLDLFVVAFFILRNFAMFGSFLGTWLPLFLDSPAPEQPALPRERTTRPLTVGGYRPPSTVIKTSYSHFKNAVCLSTRTDISNCWRVSGHLKG
jgi:hypothetical protein